MRGTYLFVFSVCDSAREIHIEIVDHIHKFCVNIECDDIAYNRIDIEYKDIFIYMMKILCDIHLSVMI